eukprot:1516205-Pleurochrysis_carterae.AAC.1
MGSIFAAGGGARRGSARRPRPRARSGTRGAALQPARSPQLQAADHKIIARSHSSWESFHAANTRRGVCCSLTCCVLVQSLWVVVCTDAATTSTRQRLTHCHSVVV